MQSILLESRTVLAVRDLRASTKFYLDVLGFQRDFGSESDELWAFLSRGNFKVMLGECPDERPASELGCHSYVAYIVVDGVDELHQEVAARVAAIISQPTSQPWGLREFAIRTPDGHRMTFGEPTSHAQ